MLVRAYKPPANGGRKLRWVSDGVVRKLFALVVGGSYDLRVHGETLKETRARGPHSKSMGLASEEVGRQEICPQLCGAHRGTILDHHHQRQVYQQEATLLSIQHAPCSMLHHLFNATTATVDEVDEPSRVPHTASLALHLARRTLANLSYALHPKGKTSSYFTNRFFLAVAVPVPGLRELVGADELAGTIVHLPHVVREYEQFHPLSSSNPPQVIVFGVDDVITSRRHYPDELIICHDARRPGVDHGTYGGLYAEDGIGMILNAFVLWGFCYSH